MRKCIFFLSIMVLSLPCYSENPSDDILLQNPDDILDIVLNASSPLYQNTLSLIETRKPLNVASVIADYAVRKTNNRNRPLIITALNKYPASLISEQLTKILKESRSPEIRVDIINMMSASGDKAFVPIVADELANPDDNIRDTAISALNKFSDDRMFPSIFAMSENDDPIIRVYALKALNHLYDIRLIQIIRNLLTDTNKSVRIYAIGCVRTNQITDLLQNIRNIASMDPNDEVRITAISALTAMNDTGCLNVLTKTLSASNTDLRLASAKALQFLLLRSSAYPVSERLALEQDTEIKYILINTLRSLRDLGGYRGVEQILLYDKDPSLRVLSAYVIGTISSPRSMQLLLTGLEDPDYRVRAESAGALNTYHDSRVIQLLLKIVQSDSERYVRSAALFSIEKCKDKSTILPLYDLMFVEKDTVFKGMMYSSLRNIIDTYH